LTKARSIPVKQRINASGDIKVKVKKSTTAWQALIGLLLFGAPITGADDIKKEPPMSEKDMAQSSYLKSRGGLPAFLKKTTDAKGWSKYIRFSKHDGNLVEAGFCNQGQLSSGYFDGAFYGMTWPKGANRRSYGYVFVFYVAGEVIDARGNTIHIVSDRFNRSPFEYSTDLTHLCYFMPAPRFFNMDTPDAAEVDIGGISEDVGIDGLPDTQDAGEGDGVLQPQEDFNHNGVLDLSMRNLSNYLAMSHKRETWPADWPPGSYSGDPRGPDDFQALGPCHGRWNGEYGYYVRADQESYYVMDDHENDEFEYYPENLPGTDQPDTRPWPDGRRGLGATVKVRNYQWNARLAEDILISIYDIWPTGKPIDKTVVGMYADIDLHGVDLASFDTIDDITYVWDSAKMWRADNSPPVGYFGFAFLESPGIDNDGRDNDEDGLVDESQYNGIDDDKDWRPWQDANGNGVWDTEDKNFNGLLDNDEDLNANGLLDYEPLYDDVGSDGIGPDQDDYTGPDQDASEANGLPDAGEPNFDNTDNDESDQVGLTSWYLKAVNSRQVNDEEFWNIELQPGTFVEEPGWQSDVSFTYGCGFVPLQLPSAGNSRRPFQRFAIACMFGWDEQDIFRNKRTMQQIYDSDYNFAKAPRQPFLAAHTGDQSVVLTWDNRAEFSRDPVYGLDFEGYKIYRSTDPSFSEIKTITDAFNNPVFYTAVAQFDLKDGLYGPHPIALGRESGLDSDLGISMNMGTDSGLRHHWTDRDVTNGRTYYYAVVAYDRGYDQDFYSRGLSDRPNLLTISPTECAAIIQTDNLGRPIAFDPNCVAAMPQEPAAGYVPPTLDKGIEHVSGFGNGSVQLKILTPYSVKAGNTYQVKFVDDGSMMSLNGQDEAYFTGLTSGAYFINVSENDTLLTPEARYDSTSLAEQIFNGLILSINNYNTIDLKEARWIKGESGLEIALKKFGGKAVPRDYEIRIMEVGADTSLSSNKPTNFQVWDVTDPARPFKVKYQLISRVGEPDSLQNKLNAGDSFWIYIKRSVQPSGKVTYTQKAWQVALNSPASPPIPAAQQIPQKGDICRITTTKPFDRNDLFQFTIVGNEIRQNQEREDLAGIYPVPNPYYAASSLERQVPIDVQGAGRGDRRIDFVNLPMRCTITIYTIAGKLVREIEHQSSMDQGRAMWDLRTKDGLEVSSGYYFYHVALPNGDGKSGKLAIIK